MGFAFLHGKEKSKMARWVIPTHWRRASLPAMSDIHEKKW